MKVYCFKLYRTKKLRKLHKEINIAGLIYNHCIALHKRYFKLYKKQLSVNRLKIHLTKLRNRLEYMKIIGAQTVQDIAERIDKAYKLFFRNLKHNIHTSLPKFKKVKKYKSFTLKQSGYKFIDNNKIKINKCVYKYSKSRDIKGKVKALVVKRDNLGDIYIYAVCDVEQKKILARTGESVGFDFGLKKFLTASNGKDKISPMFFKTSASAIKSANIKLSHKNKESNNYQKAKNALARLHKRIANMRHDYHWKLANEIVREYAIICIEDLNIKGMQKLYGRKINDLGYSRFIKILKYKAEQEGSIVIEVNRYFASSQICSYCKFKNSEMKNLRIRKWNCPNCKAIHDRDRNAAINIKLEGERLLRAI